MYTVKNVSGVCKALRIENGIETVVCNEGQKVSANFKTFTVKKQNNKCCIYEVKTRVLDGELIETLTKKCEEGQFI